MKSMTLYLFSGDCKILNTVCGIDISSSKYPSAICISCKMKNGTWQPNSPKRTLESIKMYAEAFQVSGKKTPINHFSCKNIPLLNPKNAPKMKKEKQKLLALSVFLIFTWDWA